MSQQQPQDSVGNSSLVEVVEASYGTEGVRGTNVGSQICAIIEHNNGSIVLDGNLSSLFGFDPAPGQHKVCSMHLRYNGHHYYLRAEEGQPFSFPEGGAPFQGGGEHIVLIEVWYGTEQYHSDNSGRVIYQIREIIERNNGRIVLDGNLNGLFGFDPARGQHKVCTMHLRYNGQEYHLRAEEGQPFSFPGDVLPQPGGGDEIVLIYAWYGTGSPDDGGAGYEVIRQIREIIERNNGSIVFDGNLNDLFGFDPAPGQHKVCTIRVRYNGQEHYLRAEEGKPFSFP